LACGIAELKAWAEGRQPRNESSSASRQYDRERPGGQSGKSWPRAILDLESRLQFLPDGNGRPSDSWRYAASLMVSTYLFFGLISYQT